MKDIFQEDILPKLNLAGIYCPFDNPEDLIVVRYYEIDTSTYEKHLVDLSVEHKDTIESYFRQNRQCDDQIYEWDPLFEYLGPRGIEKFLDLFEQHNNPPPKNGGGFLSMDPLTWWYLFKILHVVNAGFKSEFGQDVAHYYHRSRK